MIGGRKQNWSIGCPGHGLEVVSGNAPRRQGGQDGALALLTVSSSAKAVDVAV
jgi:hypothetical protein